MDKKIPLTHEMYVARTTEGANIITTCSRNREIAENTLIRARSNIAAEAKTISTKTEDIKTKRIDIKALEGLIADLKRSISWHKRELDKLNRTIISPEVEFIEIGSYEIEPRLLENFSYNDEGEAELTPLVYRVASHTLVDGLATTKEEIGKKIIELKHLKDELNILIQEKKDAIAKRERALKLETGASNEIIHQDSVSSSTNRAISRLGRQEKRRGAKVKVANYFRSPEFKYINPTKK